ncbi:MAG: YecA family protein [Xanthomonadaceae bacterium]|nr:YecA family protein [Xanthomonadaceae bacterium]MDE1959071.1 YecA family protein [Xanthomonadaceae bacterium]MDE2178008.1 YecA family protein [Xanthomonadaceae bacterium]MDE2246642.1 YecA family protein [Xanthomonadaceae bacterium]
MNDPHPTAAPLHDDELDELDDFLRAQIAEDRLMLDGVHGLLTALAVGPEPAKPDEWLPEVLHAPFVDEDQGSRILQLLARLNDSIGVELEGDAYEPILGEVEEDDGSTALTAAGWCEGFSRGIDLRASLWEARLAEDPQLMEILSPLMALAVEDGVLTADAEFEPLTDAEYEACVAELPTAISAVAQYWRVHPPLRGEQGVGAAAAEFRAPPRRRGGRWVH